MRLRPPTSPGTTTCSPTRRSCAGFGFHRHVDTEAMLLGLFDDLRKRRIIPG
jgi:hypothetical protein